MLASLVDTQHHAPFWNDVAGLETTASGILDRLEARFHADHSPGIRLVNNLCEAA